ncbi:MAG: VCBS repeat-containing protein [Verrucomicrobia bacterium]|nr:VCBS repeat-containing protein [Verrucomicrobiota bacterium]MBU1734062.1 VCBS repeat-containing protein [Verrucomicrobiota bacterium]MBU1855728.1 VCBS repeat-containing protein [Verrucomicrobiota bacterium]
MKQVCSILTILILLAASSARGAGLGVSTNNVYYEVWQNQAALSNQVEVWNTNGTDAMTFTNTVSYTNCGIYTNWLTVTPATGISYGERQGVWFQIDVTNMPPRTNAYEANVRVTAGSGTTNSPQDVQVTVLVQGIGLWVSPTNFAKVATAGQVVGDDVFQVANTGAVPHGTISYNVTATSSPTAWLSASPTNGNVQDITNDVNIGYDLTGLSAGWYTGQVDVVALGVGTQTVDVVLRVNRRPGVAWNAGSMVWTNEIMAGDSIGSTTVEVWNASGTPAGQMNYTVSVINDQFGWVSGVSPASGVSTGDHRVTTISYTTAGLPGGVYPATLKVAGVDNATGEATTNGPLYMGLKLTVKGTPVLKTDVTSLSQTVLENHSGTNSCLIWNDGQEPHGGMRYTVTPDVSWVTVIPATGVVTNEVTTNQVLWNAGTLSTGVYSGNLVVDAFDAQTSARAEGAPITITLTLTVTARTPLNMELPTVAGIMYVGQTVEANVGLWQNQARLTFSYQWERASNKAGDGREVLSGAVGTNYVITTADLGKYLRVDVTATDSEPSPKSSTADSALVDAAKVKALRADFNGDGITDLWFYDELSGTWHTSFGEASSAEGIFPGGPGMVAVPGDYDGDGNEDVAVYDCAHGMWHILFLWRCDYVYGSLFGGTVAEAEATPMVADYDGDGATDVAFYWRGYWAILYSSLGTISVVEPFADAWGEPVSGDWDGNGIAEMGVYENGLWTLRMGDGSVVEYEFGGGGSGVLPAPADYDADGATDLGVYDVGANQWRWRESRTGFEQSVSFGSGGIVPMPGYYDHDRSNDWAQVHMSADNDFIVWEVKRTTETNFPYRGQSFQQSTDRWRVSW